MGSHAKKKNAPIPAPESAEKRTDTGLFLALAAGLFLGLGLLKFGNPSIMERWVQAPTNIYEVIFGTPWPMSWAYWMIVGLAVLSFKYWKAGTDLPLVFLVLPIGWGLWQMASTARSVDAGLSRGTTVHLLACVFMFYLGVFALSRCRRMNAFWVALLVGFLLVGLSAWSQRFGGLESTRTYFWTYVYPAMTVYPTDYIKKISSNRVFGTLFYPNTLAAAIILLFPPLSAMLYRWTARGRFTTAARGLILGLWTVFVLACLFWSGSKGGWLVLMAIALVAFFRWPGIASRARLVVALLIVVCGLGGFFWTYSNFFKRGAPSVGARFDYWSAAVKIARDKPLLGSGPGTFAQPYSKIKAQQSEMARLVHNDYLQQASDAGLPAFLFYVGFVVTALILAGKRTRLAETEAAEPSEALTRFAGWLGLVGWFVHGFIEFNLYIPALAWAAFLLLGWLLGSGYASTTALSGAQSGGNV